RGGRHLAVTCRHPLVETDHERVQRDAAGDDPHRGDAQVDEAEREQQRIRAHEETEAQVVDAVLGKVDELEPDLDAESQHHHPAPLDREPQQLAKAAPGHEHDRDGDATSDGDAAHGAPPYNGRCCARLSIRFRSETTALPTVGAEPELARAYRREMADVRY